MSGSARLTLEVAEDGDALAAARSIRHAVFVVEQEIPSELDDDGLDDGAVHVLARLDDRPVATGRLVIETGGLGVLARIAVVESARGHGLGKRVVEALETEAWHRGLDRLVLHPHHYLERFYAELGYHTIAGVERAGPHQLITMEKRRTAAGS